MARSLLRVAFVICLVGFPGSPNGAAQGRYQQELAPLRVEEGDGRFLDSPFSGGLVSARIGLVDINGDLLPDLLALNPDGRLRVYHNIGNWSFTRDFPSPYDGSPVSHWFRLADLDGDNAVDLLTGGTRSELILYRNLGTTARPQWAGVADTLRADTIIFTQLETVPSLVDIDADGDLDLFSGNIEGSISFYRNDGSRMEPRFVMVTGRFQDILVISSGTRRRKDGDNGQHALHGASVLDFADLDGDGDQDLLFGDFFTTRLLYFMNDGSSTAPRFSMNRLDTAFRGFGDDVESYGFNQPGVADVDGDGDIDVLVSSLYPNSPLEALTPYENSGTRTEPRMRRRQGGITGELDFGANAAPCELRDRDRWAILVGNADGTITEFSVEPDAPRSTLRRLRTHAALPGRFNGVPAAADIDADGVAEVVTGSADGSDLRLFRREGEALVQSPWIMDTARVGRYASPTFVDLDNDLDYDLMVGSSGGRFQYFENRGTPSAPDYVAEVPPSPFDTLDVGAYSSPRFFDVDGDGDQDALVGARTAPGDRIGNVRIWLNDGTGKFSEQDAFPPLISDVQPIPLGLTLPEARLILVGEAAGGITAWRDTSFLSSADNEVLESKGDDLRAILVGRDLVRIEGNIGTSVASLCLIDIRGREACNVPVEGLFARLPDLPAGWYMVRIGDTFAGPVTIQR